ncbi:cytochrome P450 family protein [Planomonospora venezuelensis]|uniref:Cytochrome P450 n=1 Tax=Planomonospora venezuelensis TaxID=1999 RepID=A0A841DHB8_PLAVE|nr:cytochrome P450 [Planomonospora venezuelensis]MBB5966576.1 cytochrome P450 [Planomonospora venezuelensis]GIN02246.1 cytochrome P450 [Planomonospora venezuelensis]
MSERTAANPEGTGNTGNPERLPLEFLFSPEFTRDPYAEYGRLREKGPVHPIDFPPGVSSFLVIDHEHGRAALSDPRLAKNLRNGPDLFRELAGGNPALAENLLSTDPPDHTRLRRLVSRAFTARRVESLRPRIQEITDRLIDTMAARGRADLLDDFAFPLPITVICELLGVPAGDRDDFRVWSATLVTPSLDEESVKRRDAVNTAIRAYFSGLIAERRAEPRDDMVSALVTASDEDELLSEPELIAMLTLLLIAGHETTVNLIGNGMLALLTHPGQLRLLQEEPELIPGAVEEFLRYDGPVERATLRFATEDLRIAGVRIPEGSMVQVSLGAAGRDPGAFDDPDALDVTRDGGHHLAFGHGVHFCLGAPLARLEARIAFGTLLRRLPDIALDCAPEQLEWRGSASIVRGLQALPVRF